MTNMALRHTGTLSKPKKKTPVDTHAQLTCPSEEKIALEKPKKAEEQ